MTSAKTKRQARRDRPTPATLEAVYATERKQILRYLNRRVGRDAAPDLVNEIFARAYSSAQARQLDNPIGFVRRITRNLLIDRARRRARRPETFYEFDEQRNPCTPDQTWAIEAADLLNVYNRTLAELSEKTRRVFLLRRQEGMTERQVAEMIGISENTVGDHLKRATKAFRIVIAEYNDGLPYQSPFRKERP